MNLRPPPALRPAHASGPGVVALLVVLVSWGLGAGVVGVLAALDAGASSAGHGRPSPDAGTPGPGPRQTPSPRAAAPPAPLTSVAREVLREWDRRRAAAWASGDTRALASLYLPDAVAGRRDVAMLRRWNARGARVVSLQPQVLALEVLHDAGRRLVVRVTDRLGVVQAEIAGRQVDLPHDRPTTRRIELRRGSATTSVWRVASVGVGLSP